MRRNHLKGREGDRINAVLAAVDYNFSLLLRLFRSLLCARLLILARAVLVPASMRLHDDKRRFAHITGEIVPLVARCFDRFGLAITA
jgi:hypothetical protein